METIFLARPTGSDGLTHERSSIAVLQSGHPRTVVAWGASSILTHNFNRLLCDAYNKQAELGLTHFAMLHSDIAPAAGWLALLLAELKAHNLQVLSAVSPLKCNDGLTSTGLDLGHKVRRLSLAEVFTLPETFTGADTHSHYGNSKLMLNTGCWIMDMSAITPDQAFFTIQDSVTRDPAGHYVPDFKPEDWLFSRRLNELGIRTGATRKVKLEHYGSQAFTNSQVWGTKGTDE